MFVINNVQPVGHAWPVDCFFGGAVNHVKFLYEKTVMSSETNESDRLMSYTF
jgi:hypothetical protein